jgi:hypothetical protein
MQEEEGRIVEHWSLHLRIIPKAADPLHTAQYNQSVISHAFGSVKLSM